MSRFVAGFIAVVSSASLLACAATDDPAAPSASASASADRTTAARARDPIPAGESIHGLVVPAGSEHVASNEIGDDFIVPLDPARVTAYIESQLIDAAHETREPQIAEFRRVTPKSENPDEVRLFIRVMPYPGRGTSLRVQRLPAVLQSPEQTRENLERFRREHPRLD